MRNFMRPCYIRNDLSSESDISYYDHFPGDDFVPY